MKVELKVGSAVASCETDHKPLDGQALFLKLLDVTVTQINKWLYEPQEPVGTIKPPNAYVRKLEEALEPILAIEGAIEQAKRTDRKITCREDERLFQCLDAVAKAQEIMLPVLAFEQAAREVRTKMAEATA